MTLVFISAICLFVYLFISITVPIQVFPEFFFYPWLVSKGLVQYRDFFDHHGFLTNILFSPFMGNGAVLISTLFVVVQCIQFVLIASLVSERIKNPILFSLLLVLYGAFQFTIIGQQIWFDQLMAFLLMSAWYFFEIRREGVGWLFFAFATMIKPPGFIFCIPFYLLTKNKKKIFIFIGAWIISLLYFYQQGGLVALWQQLMLFNTSYIQSTYRTHILWIGPKLFAGIGLAYISIIILSLLKKKKNASLILACFYGALLFFQGLAKVNLAISVPFFVILFAERLADKKFKKISLLIFLVFFLIIGRDAIKTYGEIRYRTPYLSLLPAKEIAELKRIVGPVSDKKVLVVGNRVELYYHLSVLPPEFIPLRFPWIDAVYPHKYLFDGIRIVIIPKTFNAYENISNSEMTALKRSFHRIGQTTSFTVWRYNNK